jgi:hypothetical protein
MKEAGGAGARAERVHAGVCAVNYSARRMAEPSNLFLRADPGSRLPGDRRAGAGLWGLPVQVAVPAVIIGTALLGVAAGFIWAAVAPRAVIVVAGPGSANILSAETTAYIAADAWFVLLSVIGGVMSGLCGYLLAVRRHGAVAVVAVLAGAVAAALIAKWVGEQPGQAAVNHSLALGHPGTLLNQPLALGGIGALAFWPLAAGLVVAGIEAVAVFRERLKDPRGGAPRPLTTQNPGDGAAAE